MMPVCGPAIFVRGFAFPLSVRLKTRIASSDARPPLSTRLATMMQSRRESAARP